jgi:hypothetical protein
LNIGRSNLATVFVDVLHPLLVLVKAVGRDTNNLDVALREVVSTTSNLTELSSADGSEVSRVGKEDSLRLLRY